MPIEKAGKPNTPKTTRVNGNSVKLTKDNDHLKIGYDTPKNLTVDAQSWPNELAQKGDKDVATFERPFKDYNVTSNPTDNSFNFKEKSDNSNTPGLTLKNFEQFEFNNGSGRKVPFSEEQLRQVVPEAAPKQPQATGSPQAPQASGKSKTSQDWKSYFSQPGSQQYRSQIFSPAELKRQEMQRKRIEQQFAQPSDEEKSASRSSTWEDLMRNAFRP